MNCAKIVNGSDYYVMHCRILWNSQVIVQNETNPGDHISFTVLWFVPAMLERPPLLFEVKSDDSFLCIGGIPWHYIITPCNTLSNFEIYSVATHQLVGIAFCAFIFKTLPCNFVLSTCLQD